MGLVRTTIICKNSKVGLKKSAEGGLTMTTQERQNIETRIAQLKAEEATVKGTPCEVYSRVVGYLRPVTMWNKGKKEEFAMRKNMRMS